MRSRGARPQDLRAQLDKLRERGDVPASIATGEALFPRRLTVRTPTSQDMAERFERRRAVLSELLDLVLPATAIDLAASGVGRFARRYGYRDKPERIRFRLSDGPLAGADVTLDAAAFAQLAQHVSQAFITENEINFLAFPMLPGAIVVFGAGYGFDALRAARWLEGVRIHYWGDIDTHGFAILAQLRSVFPRVESLLMVVRPCMRSRHSRMRSLQRRCAI